MQNILGYDMKHRVSIPVDVIGALMYVGLGGMS